MRKFLLPGLLLLFLLSVIGLIVKFSNPFGWIFHGSLKLFFLSIIAFLFLAGRKLWIKRVWLRLPGLILFLITGVFFFVFVVTQIDYRLLIPMTSSSLTREELEEDITFFRESLKNHPAYDSLIGTDAAQLQQANPEALSTQLMGVVGLFKDGHSWVPPFQAFDRSQYFPLNGFWFDDGYYVLSAADEYADLINKKILKIGGRKIEEVFTEVNSLSGPENEWNAKYRFDLYLYNSRLLRRLGVIQGEGVDITYQHGSGERAMTIRSEPFINWLFWSLKPTGERYPVFMKLRQPNLELHVNGGVVDLEFNRIESNPDFTIVELAQTLDSVFNSKEIDRFMIDLRNNVGGNNQLYDPIIEVIQKHEHINQKNRFFVLTSRTTFSAGINFLDDLRYKTDATLIGEPAGSGGNHFGDAQLFMLPHSGIFYFISTRRWEGNNPADTARTILPDIKVELLFSDYLDGKDPWIEAIESVKKE